MNRALVIELQEIVDELAPPLLDIDELHRLVAIDESHDYFDGECSEHEGCRPVNARRFW